MARFVHPAFLVLNSSGEVTGLVWESELLRTVTLRVLCLCGGSWWGQTCASGGVLQSGIGVVVAD